MQSFSLRDTMGYLKKGGRPVKKKLAALACTVVLILSLLPGQASASGLYFLGLNDTLAPQSSQTTPITSGGTPYLPVTALNSRVTGVNFGIYYAFGEDGNTLNVYNLSGRKLIFNLTDGTMTTESNETPTACRVVYRGGLAYVPAYTVCQHFGLACTQNSTEYGPLLRIKDSKAVLGDALFINSTASMMRTRYNAYQASLTPAPAEPEKPAPKFSLYLGVRGAAGTDMTALFNGLANVRASAVVFFPAEAVLDCADQIRQAAGRGHRVGLIPSGDTPEARLKSVQTGADLVEKIIRQEVWFVLGSEQTLADAGYLCWSAGLNVAASGTSVQVYDSIVAYGEGKSGIRVLLDGRASGANLSAALRELSMDGDTFLAPRETRY